MEILVFKTNISKKQDIERVETMLSKHNDIFTWHVDTEDCDNVLRIEARANISSQVKELLHSGGYFCHELL